MLRSTLVLGLLLITASLPNVVLGSPPEGPEAMETQAVTIFDFESSAEPWPSIDDPVMGGLSRSRMRLRDGIAVFEGVVSLENNGGFASTRSRPNRHDLTGFDGIALRIRGDGKTYGVRLRTDGAYDGVNYQAKVETEAGRWLEIRLPFETFEPRFRGRQVRNHPALNPRAIRTFGFIISDKQEGRFQLEIDSIKAYHEPSDGS